MGIIKAGKWYTLRLSFQLKDDWEFPSDKEYLELVGKIGKVIGREGFVDDVSIKEDNRKQVK